MKKDHSKEKWCWNTKVQVDISKKGASKSGKERNVLKFINYITKLET